MERSSALFRKALDGDIDAVHQFPRALQEELEASRLEGVNYSSDFHEGNVMLSALLVHQRNIQAELLAELPPAARQLSADQIAKLREGLADWKRRLDDIQ